MSAVNLAALFAGCTAPWQPVLAARYNGLEVMVGKGEGSYPWHKHEHTDDLFLVLKGRLVLEMRDQQVALEAGDLYVIPRGVEHRPVVAEGEEAYFLLMEPPLTAEQGTTAV